ncbi:hypothetical protein HYDPIDRAFT_117669 [Hydnomerulius pinastri MD-312]|uniref:Uncharacterized protein n=1 Tax=Hydnomerulius pinastri MD-312 TaxID=994086 RepID=A0A0C9W228_9AGAM|nr:hypothetical protein HYDPIDRAFT_117669 [Hydnomerulius pinastri MD-312]
MNPRTAQIPDIHNESCFVPIVIPSVFLLGDLPQAVLTAYGDRDYWDSCMLAAAC